MGSRRKARELALQLLYKLDVSGEVYSQEDVARFLEEYAARDEDRDYAVVLIQNTCNHMAELDGLISANLENWTLDRLSVIDRNILRFATCELQYFLDIPVNVTINEAIEVAKKFGLEESATFINGVLDKVAKETRKGKA
jgi:N utilization substance protein B